MTTNATDPLIGINALSYYLKRICTFLGSDKKTLSCPNTSQQLQDVLMKISTENTEFLNGIEYNNNVRMEADKLLAAFKTNAKIKLTHEICDTPLGSNVLVFKKAQVNTYKVPEPLRQPRVPSSMLSATTTEGTLEPPTDGSVTTMFKTHCLNCATEFVKDDTQLVMRFPEMEAAQAEFVMEMILPGKEGKTDKSDVGFGFRSMYAPLWECMRLFSLKYDYDVAYSTRPVTKEGMKRVVFKKIRKSKTEATDVDSAEIPTVIIDSDDENKLDDRVLSSSTSAVSLNTGKVAKKSKKRVNVKRKADKKIEMLIRKVDVNLRKERLTKELVIYALRRISVFLLDDAQSTVEFYEMSKHEVSFLQNLKRLSINVSTYMLFDHDAQRLLDDIKYCLHKKNVDYELRVVNSGSRKNSLKNVVFEKIFHKAPEVIDLEASEPADGRASSPSSTSTTSDTSISTKSEKTTKKAKNKEAKQEKEASKVVEKLGSKLRRGFLKEQDIEDTLTRICDFLDDEQQASIVFKPRDAHHLKFIKSVGQLACREVAYSLFTPSSRNLLAHIERYIKRDMKYKVRAPTGRKEVILEKLPCFATREPVQETGRSERVKLKSVACKPPPPALSPQDQELLDRLQTIKEEAARGCGDQVISAYLLDISGFLHPYNTYSTLTFDSVPEAEVRFLKELRTLSGFPPGYCMFPQEDRELLSEIQLDAQRHKLRFQTQPDDCGCWTVTLEKKCMSPGPEIVQPRARSLSPCTRAPVAKLPARDVSSRRVRETLKAGLAQPVHSDKALRIMESMGWKGGALGIRGVGITEPIALPLDLARRAGFGHVAKAKKDKLESKPRKSRPAKREVASTASETNLPLYCKPVASLQPDLIPPRILPKGLEGRGEERDEKCKTVVLSDDYRAAVLRSIREVLTTDLREMHFFCLKNTSKVVGFLKHAVRTFNGRYRFDLSNQVLKDLVAEITQIFEDCKDIALNVEIKKKTKFYPSVVVVKTHLPIQNKTSDSQISQIDEKEKTTDNQNTIINDQEMKKNDQEMETNDQLMETIDQEMKTNDQLMETNDQEMKTNDQEMETNDQDSITNNDPTSDTQDSTLAWYRDPPDNQELTKWYHIKVSTGRRWYFPVKLKRKQAKSTDKQKTQVPELKVIAQALCNQLGIRTDAKMIDVTTPNEQNKTYILTQLYDESNSFQQETMPDKQSQTDGLTDRYDKNYYCSVQQETMANEQNKTDGLSEISNNDSLSCINEQNKTTELTKRSENNYSMEQSAVETQELKPIQKSKMLLRIPSMTRKQFALSKQGGTVSDVRIQRTSYTLEVEKYRINKNLEINVKVTKNSPSREPKRMKMANNEAQQELTRNSQGQPMQTNSQQELTRNSQGQPMQTNSQQELTRNSQGQPMQTNSQQELTRNNQEEELITHTQQELVKYTQQQGLTAEAEKLPGVMLLEKLTINNNYSTTNKNAQAMSRKEKRNNAKLTVSKSLQVTVTNSDATSKINSVEDKASSINNVAPIVNNNAPRIDDSASNVENVNLNIDKVAPILNNSPLSDTDLICDKTRNIKIAEDSNSALTNNIKDGAQNDTDSVIYIIPIECTRTIVDIPKGNTLVQTNEDTVAASNNVNLKENKGTSETNCINKSDLYVEDVKCETIFDNARSSIVNNSDDEGMGFGDEIIIEGPANNLTEDIENNTKNKLTTHKDSRKIIRAKENNKNLAQENDINKIDNGADDHVTESTSIETENSKPALIQERKRPSLEYPNTLPKKSKLLVDFKKIYILPKNHPQITINNDKVREIQSAILQSIDYTKETLPLLKCQGIQNGGLIYSCQDEKSLFFMENLIQKMDHLKILYEFDIEDHSRRKMAFRINSYVDEPVCNVLNRLELYNNGLNSTKWSVIKKEQYGDFSVIYVEMDEASFDHVCEANFVLYTGNDCARFTIVWD